VGRPPVEVSPYFASDASQIVTNWQGIELFVAPYGNIDDFEGTVFSFAPGRAPLEGIDPETKLHLSGGSAWDD
jgi:hypothetical protein